MSCKIASKYKQTACFNTIRLIGAIQVLWGHATTHLSVDIQGPFNSILSFFPGVPIFFVISGFLIWGSVGRSVSWQGYMRKRASRIFPELWVAVLFEIIVMLLLIETIPPIVDIILFVITQSTCLQFWTPDSMRIYGCGTPNGSLWTMCVIIQFYIVVWWIYQRAHGKHVRYWLWMYAGIILIAYCLEKYVLLLPTILRKLYGQTIIPYLWLFLLGAAVSEFSQKSIPMLKKYWIYLLLISLLCYLTGVDVPGFKYPFFRCITLCLGLIGFAYAMPRLNLPVDISYAIYLYHMTVVNALIEIGIVGNVWALLIAVIVSLLLALISTKQVGRLVRKLCLFGA